MHNYDSLSPEKIISAVESLGIRCNAILIPLNSYENRVYQVGIDNGEPIIAKFYRPGRWSSEQIIEEHEFSMELANADVSVVAPFKISDKTLFQFDTFRFSLFARRGGYPPELEDLSNLKVLGRTLGRIHSIGQTRVFQYRPSISCLDEIRDSSIFLLGQFIPDELKSAYESLISDIIKLCHNIFSDQLEIPSIRIHGDCHIGNILWRDDAAHFVDFDDCRNGPPIQDLWMFLSGLRADKEIQLNELIKSYREFCDFDPNQIRLIEVLRTLRVINYAAWLARRWDDPAFPKSFPWFNTMRYWSDHILELREQLAAIQEEPLRLMV